jgi:DNA-binding response OmpR family regulator
MPSLLLIDGDRNFREALAIALRLDGCQVSGLSSADDGLAALGQGGFDLCVVDWHLGGAERFLKAALASPVRVVLTGPHADLLERASRRFPGAQVLPKPFAARELLARLAA